MTLSNKITLSRLAIIPLMIIVVFIKPLQEIMLLQSFINISLAELLFAILFVLASLSDILDGYLARKRNEITDFGKFLDPIADKVLTLTGLLYIVTYKTQHTFWWVLILIIVTREFVVSAVRMLAARKDIVIAASVYGKIKTGVTLTTIILILFNRLGLDLLFDKAYIITDVLMYISVLVTFLSGLDYIIKNKEVFNENKVK